MRDLCRLLGIPEEEEQQSLDLEGICASHPLEPGALSAAKIDAVRTWELVNLIATPS